MTKWFVLLFIGLLCFLCLCIGGNQTPEGDATTTTESVVETATSVEEIEEVTTTTEEEEWVTPTEFYIDYTTTTYIPEDYVPTTAPVTASKYRNGVRCSSDSECVSGSCITGVCCNMGQCVSGTKCYNTGQSRADKRVCQGDGSWKKMRLTTCYTDAECVTNLCTGGLCCNSGECGSAFVGKCYSAGEISFDQTQTCIGGSWKKVNGQTCSSSSECGDGTCSSGYCCAAGSCGYDGKCYHNGESLNNNVCTNGAWKRK